MNKVAPETQVLEISDAPEGSAAAKRKERDESVAALREFFKELFRYLFTLLCFTLVIFLDSNWSQKHNSAQLFVRNIFDPETAPKDVNAFWEFLHNTDDSGACSGGVFCILSKLDYFSQELLNGQNSTENTFLYFGNRLLGKVRLRQVRVQDKVCSRFWKQFDGAHNKFCYPDYTDGQEETTFVKNWKSTEAVDTTEFDSSVQDAFKWKSTSETGEFFIFPGVLGSYPGSGYVLDFATSSVERAQQLSNLQESHWIDIKTRAVFLDMAFYNPNTDMFVTIRMLFEFHACGFVSMMPTYRVMRLDKYPMNDFWNFLEIGAQGGVALMVLYYIIQESQEIFHAGPREYFKNFWNTMDITNLVLFLAIFYLRVATTFEIQSNVLRNVQDLTSPQLQNIAFQVDLEKNLIGINCILLWVKFLKYVSAHKTFSRITRTIGLAASEILIFFLIFGLSMFGFAMGGVLILGVDNDDYSTLSTSISTLLRCAFGDFDYNSVVSANRVLGPVFFFMWLLYAAVILLNMAIAIISESFVKILEQDEETKGETTIFDYMEEIAIFRTINQLMSDEKRAEHVLDELENIDQDGDHLISKEEIIAFCQKNPDALAVLGVESVDALMGKFDGDGSGELDEEELKQLRAYINEKRKENQERIRKLQETVGNQGAPSALRPFSAGSRVHARASFSEEPGREVIMELEDVEGGTTARTRGSRPSSRGGKGDGVESTHAVFKNVESQVHQLGVSLESVTAHVAALAHLASLSANSGSHSFGGNGSATPRLGASLRDRPDVIDTHAEVDLSEGDNASPSIASRRRALPAAAMSPGMAKYNTPKATAEDS